MRRSDRQASKKVPRLSRAKRSPSTAGQHTPEEFWERMRADPAAAPTSGPSPGLAVQPTRTQSAAPESAASDAAPSERHAPSNAAPPDAEDASAGELVKQLSDQAKTLVTQELRLAQLELQEKGKKIGIGAGIFGAGGVVAFLGVAVLIAAAVLALSTALAPWLAALIVGVVLLAIAGGAARMGKQQIEQAAPPVPEKTVETVKEDVQHLKAKVKR
jgi:uncharacterized membrane protein YqjE